MRGSCIAAIVLAAFAGCSGGRTLPTGPSPVAASLEIHYLVSTSKPSSAVPTELECVGQVSASPGWWGFAQVSMFPVAEGDWAVRFENVPIGRQRLRVRAPAGCAAGSIDVNGVRLGETKATDARSDGAFEFLLHSDGSVTP